jgi:hypothetical protein
VAFVVAEPRAVDQVVLGSGTRAVGRWPAKAPDRRTDILG